MSGRMIRSITVLGEGLAAGAGDFATYSETQKAAFPALLAQALGAQLTIPALQAPGIPITPGFPSGPVIQPAWMQSFIFEQVPPPPPSNLAIPGATLSEAIRMRPSLPFIWRENAKQTAVNLILGGPTLPFAKPGASQLESAIALRADLAIVCLGYSDFALALTEGATPPSAKSAAADFREICTRLQTVGTQVVLASFPDPTISAWLSDLHTASEILRVDESVLNGQWGLSSDALLTVFGLHEIGYQVFAKQAEPLTPRAACSSARVLQLRALVKEWNAEVEHIAQECGAWFVNLASLWNSLHSSGIRVGQRVLSARYLDGFYSLNGLYPGLTGQAIIAQGFQAALSARGLTFPGAVPDPQTIAKSDPAFQIAPACGRKWTFADFGGRLPPAPPPPAAPVALPPIPPPDSTWSEDPLPSPLRVPFGQEIILTLNSSASYFGDAIAAMNAPNPQDAYWGSGAYWLFGGYAMVDSHLSGRVRIRFGQPQGNLCPFRIVLENLAGADARLDTPGLFSMAFIRSSVRAAPDSFQCGGSVDLTTGLARTNSGPPNVLNGPNSVALFAQYSSSALEALVAVNPGFPPVVPFPGQYGATWARFSQRPDGTLDFTFYGSTYVPLNQVLPKPPLWPLNFHGVDRQYATIQAAGTVMHPHLHLTTVPSAADPQPSRGPDCFNEVRELTLHTYNSMFGDDFLLNSPILGGHALGGSHVLGRAMIQFGPRCGDCVPIVVSLLGPGGVLADLPVTPITRLFPGKLSSGPVGFYETLRFPLRLYSLDDLDIISDPFDISVGMVNLRTGQIINPMDHRGFIHQDLIFSLLRVSPETAGSVFSFRGPSSLRRSGDELIYRLTGQIPLPFPEGTLFPMSDLTGAFPAGPGSALGPYLWIEAHETASSRNAGEIDPAIRNGSSNLSVFRKFRSESLLLSSVGELFSCNWKFSPSGEASFEYNNPSDGGTFRMNSLAWIGFSSSPGSAKNKRDTVTFAGFGIWKITNPDGTYESTQQVAAQICVSQNNPYIGIQIGSGDVSNVNLKPPNELAKP